MPEYTLHFGLVEIFKRPKIGSRLPNQEPSVEKDETYGFIMHALPEERTLNQRLCLGEFRPADIPSRLAMSESAAFRRVGCFGR